MRHLLNFTPSDDLRDQMRRSVVPLRRRRQGRKVNPLAHPDLRIQSLAYLGAPAAFGGTDGFDVYAFDNWQLLDEMVDWEGLVPNAEMTDAAHRNGVPMLGTVFLNWSTAQTDRDKVNAMLQEDSEDSGTYPAARKLAEMAEYYRFDGYFFNQETAMPADQGYGESWMSFLSYLKRYAEQQNYPLQIAWYDAMHNNGRRYHGDGVSEANNLYILADDDGLMPIDQFFMNFNWRAAQVEQTVQEMQKAGRSPYDAYAGLELQANGAYRMNVNREALIDPESRQGRLSLGLFVPDTIMGLAEDSEDLHRHERIFWTGPGGDPATADDSGSWSGIARWAADKTAAVNVPFNTFFNTGHGRRWFTDGEISRNSAWNSRSVQDLMPTWRWQIRSEGGNSITARYDFDRAWNGGSSLRFEGELAAGSTTEIMLYSTELILEGETFLKAVALADPGARISIGLNTDPAYSDNAFTYYDLPAETSWQTTRESLSSLLGRTVCAISVRIEADQDQEHWTMNLGGLAILNDEEAPAIPSKGDIAEVQLHNGVLAEAIVHVQAVDLAEFYEVYQATSKGYAIITASSSPIIYLPRITRSEDASGTEQELLIKAVGRNGNR